jgi:hypothetical protein
VGFVWVWRRGRRTRDRDEESIGDKEVVEGPPAGRRSGSRFVASRGDTHSSPRKAGHTDFAEPDATRHALDLSRSAKLGVWAHGSGTEWSTPTCTARRAYPAGNVGRAPVGHRTHGAGSSCNVVRVQD